MYSKKQVVQVADEIRLYLDGRPNAMDDIDGVIWWITRQQAEESKKMVHLALEYLIDRHEVVRVVRGGKERYRKADTAHSTGTT